MAVDAAQIRLVRESLPSIREHRVPVSMNFYDNLFALAPELRELFRSDIAGQGMRFMTTLATIADLLDAPDELSDEIDDLAKAHAGLGVKAADFAPDGSRSHGNAGRNPRRGIHARAQGGMAGRLRSFRRADDRTRRICA